MPPQAAGANLVSPLCWYRQQVPDMAWAPYSKVGVFLRARGRMYFATVAIERWPVWSMMVWVEIPTLATSVQ